MSPIFNGDGGQLPKVARTRLTSVSSAVLLIVLGGGLLLKVARTRLTSVSSAAHPDHHTHFANCASHSVTLSHVTSELLTCLPGNLSAISVRKGARQLCSAS
jgi:hypothetical protein